MANGNTMNDMEMVNVKNQMKMGEMMKKIGKGKRKVSVTFALGSRRYLHKLIDEMKKQRAATEEPAVSIKVVPSTDAANVLNLVLKNSGGSPAYNVSVKFDPDLPYKDITLNQLNLFHDMALLDKGESVELFLASAPDYFRSNKQKGQQQLWNTI